MRKRINKVLLTLAITSAMLFSACGKQPVETSGEVKDSEVEAEEESTTEAKSVEADVGNEATVESTTEADAETDDDADVDAEEEVEELDPENRTYTTYPVFIEEFTLEDGVLTVTTADVNLADFPLPESMEFMFSFPLAEDCKWMHPYVLDEENLLDTDFMYSLLSYELEGVVFDLNNYKDGKAPYESDEAFCTFHNVWTFTVENGKVTEVANTGFNDATTNDETTATVAEQNKVQEAEPTATPQSVATPTPAPVHQHSYNSSVTTSATCASTGVKTFTCSCGDNYTESIPKTDHNWSPVYQTVHHDSKGEMQQVQTGSTSDTYECKYCGYTTLSFDDLNSHWLSQDTLEHAGSRYLVHPGEPIYDYQWVVTQEAYDEQVLVGHSCSVCGATK